MVNGALARSDPCSRAAEVSRRRCRRALTAAAAPALFPALATWFRFRSSFSIRQDGRPRPARGADDDGRRSIREQSDHAPPDREQDPARHVPGGGGSGRRARAPWRPGVISLIRQVACCRRICSEGRRAMPERPPWASPSSAFWLHDFRAALGWPLFAPQLQCWAATIAGGGSGIECFRATWIPAVVGRPPTGMIRRKRDVPMGEDPEAIRRRADAKFQKTQKAQAEGSESYGGVRGAEAGRA
jgi:hypothetical protein